MGKMVETLRKNHNVYVLTFCNDQYEAKLLSNHPEFQYIKTSRLSFIRSILTHINMPNLFAIRSDKEFGRKVCQIIKEKRIDIVHAEYTQMGQYIWIKEQFPEVIFNLVSHDVVRQSYERQCREGSLLSRFWASIEREKVKRYEKQYLAASDSVFVFNKKDEALLHDFYGICHTWVINPYYGLDFEVKNPGMKKERAVCFVGQMGRAENHKAALRLIRIFREIDIPGWKLNIIGANPKEELKKEESERIHVTGFVDNINKEIEKNEIAVFPLTTGAGIKFKVLLALGLRVPVITTSVGAEGIDPEGKVLILAESDEEIKKNLKKLIEDDAYRQVKSNESFDFVRKNFDWEYSENVLKEVYG